jgi:MFS family permease
MNAVALNNVGMNLSRLIMPAFGGFLLAVTDSYWVFFIMTGFYVLAVLTLVKVPAQPIEVPPEEQLYAASMAGARGRRGGGGHGGGEARRSVTGIGDLWDGMRYIARDRTIGMILLVNFLMVMFSMPYMQMLPGFVQQVLGGGAGMQGALMSFTAVGSLASALVIASLPSRHRGKLLIGGALMLGVALTAFSFSNIFWVTAPVMIFLGAGQSARMAVSNTLVQSYADDAYRGRVMSIYMMEMSLVQIGTFFVGLAAQAMGVQWALGLTSLSLVALAVGTYLFLPRMRHLD